MTTEELETYIRTVEAVCESLRARIDELERQLADKRNDRWHETYNLALAKLLRQPTAQLTPDIETHESAKFFADHACGKR